MPRLAPYLYRRKDALYFRISVPQELRYSVGGREIVKSLKTSNRSIAHPVALSLAAKAKRMFTELREGMAKSKDDDGSKRFDYKLEYQLDELGQLKGFAIDAEPHETESVVKAVNSILSESAKNRAPISAAVTTSTSDTKKPSPDCPESIPTLKTVVDGFLKKYQQKDADSMSKKHVTALTMLLEMIGDKPINTIKQADINEYFEVLERLPPRWKDACRKHKLSVSQLAELKHETTIGPKTFKDTYIASIRPFLKAAKRDWQDQGFPLGLTTDGIEYLGDREENENKQRAFKEAELSRIFEGQEVKNFASDPALHHQFWILHLGLYTGARVNELCQINPQIDVLQDEDSERWYLLISEETEADPRIKKSVKTGDSRKVPVHKKLIELGFIDYVKSMKKAGHKLLFPAWKPIRKRASGEAEKWVRSFLREIAVRDETPMAKILGMHAFRHTLLTYGLRQKPQLILTCITGHADAELPQQLSSVAKGYVTLSMLEPIGERAELLDQLDYGLIFATPAGVEG